MNLSHKLTFSIFSILLVAGLAFVPTIMAATGGPTVESIIADATPTDIDGTNGSGTEKKSPVSSDGSAIILIEAATGHQTDGTGKFSVIVTFSEDVYVGSAPADQATEAASAVPGTLISSGDIAVYRILKTGLATHSTNVSQDGITRYITNPDRATGVDPIYSKRKFVVTMDVQDVSGNLPLAIFLRVGADNVFSKATAEDIPNDIDAEDGIGNQKSARSRFNIFNVFPVAPTLGGSSHTTPSPIHQELTLTLAFTGTAPQIDGAAATTSSIRSYIDVNNGNIKSDDTSTADVDEGVNISSDGLTWTLKIIPAGGVGQHYTLTVKNLEGAPFVFTRSYTIDSRPPSLRVNFSGTPVKGGGVFTITIVYGVAPANNLTQAGVSIEGGTIVSGTFSGEGTTYTLDVDPVDTTTGNPGTLTIRVGQDSRSFTIPAPDATTPQPTDDPHKAVSFTLTKGIGARSYLVVNPVTITSTDYLDVLPSSLAAADRETQSTMPDLEDLLYGGGTVDVYVNATGAVPDININEVMWALDDNAVGTDDHTAHQWIELYNNSDTNAAANTITLWFKPRTLSGVPTNKGTRTDRLSNVLKYDLLNTGWSILNKGQSGNSHADSTKEFKSMYRKGDNGIHPDSWGQSTLLSHVKHRGTPGKGNTRDSVQPTTDTRPGLKPNGDFDADTFEKIRFLPPKSHVLINEVHNNSNNDLDWLELRFLQNVNLENWTLSYVKSDRTEQEIMRFPKRGFSAGDILLIVNKDPQDTNLAEGQDVTLAGANQARGAGTHKYWNPSGGNSSSAHYLDIPDHNGGAYFLILRTGKGWERFGSRDRMHDAVGTGAIAYTTLKAATPADVKREPHTKFAKGNGGDDKGYIWETLAWPINGHARGKGLSNKGINAKDSNNGNSLLQTDRKFAVGSVFARNGEAHGIGKDGIYNPGNKGGLGYDRNVVASGTPGYDNGVVKNKSTDLAGGTVVVSEIMLTTDSGRYPQWLELHNTSNNTVDLHADTDGNGARQGWSIRVENHRSDSWNSRRRDRLNIEVKFRALGVRFIPPNQTILITGDKVRNSSAKHFPNHRVASIWEKANGSFKMENRRDIFLNLKGFRLEIVDGSGQVSDAIGNLDGKGPDVFNPDNIDFDNPSDNGDWNWPSEAQMIIRNRRTSLIRLYDDGVARTGTPDGPTSKRGAILPIGIDKIWFGEGKVGEGDAMKTYAKYAGYAWVHAVDTKLAKAQITWYGSEDDYGTPLHTTGTPLPVELSFFRPTLENGKVTIQWTTESELDNAGFNILRSDTRNGEFTKVNEQMIQGNGTTAERTTYKWVDTTAKPGVVYYYQIEDVSFAGQHNILATTKLKGLISAKGKLTTQWGELKNLR